jgi:hypothetical protein
LIPPPAGSDTAVSDTPNEKIGLVKSVLLAYMILALHVLLIAGLGLMVLFFRGFVHYMLWIFLAGAALIGYSGYRFWRRMKTEGKTLAEMLGSPVFRGRSVEVSLLGGIASIKLGRPEGSRLLSDEDVGPAPRRLEDPDTARIRELSELARLLERDLITRQEYDTAKERLLRWKG